MRIGLHALVDVENGAVTVNEIQHRPQRDGGVVADPGQAHKLHHATIGKEGGVSFGFVFARDPAKLKAELKAQKDAGLAVVRDSAGVGEEAFETVGRNL